MRSAGNFLAGLILGGLVGAAVALLLAPAGGEELRGRLQSEADRLRLEVQRAAEERRRELEEQLRALRSPQPPA